MTAKALNVRVPEALYDQIEALAKTTARTKGYLTVDALSHYVQRESSGCRTCRPAVLLAGDDRGADRTRANAMSNRTRPPPTRKADMTRLPGRPRRCGLTSCNA